MTHETTKILTKKRVLILEQINKEHDEFTGISNPAGPKDDKQPSPTGSRTFRSPSGASGKKSPIGEEKNDSYMTTVPKATEISNSRDSGVVTSGHGETATSKISDTADTSRNVTTSSDGLQTVTGDVKGAKFFAYTAQSSAVGSRGGKFFGDDLAVSTGRGVNGNAPSDTRPRANQVAPAIGRRGSKILGEESVVAAGERSRSSRFFGHEDGVDHSGAFKRRATTIGKATSVIKALPDIHHERTIKDCLLFSVLRPLFVTMAICGIFFVKPMRARGFSGGRLVNWSVSKIYCCVVFAVLTASTVRAIFAFDFINGESFSNELFFKVLWTIFWYECLSRSYLNIAMCWAKKKNLEAFLINLEKICYPDAIIPYEHDLTRAQRWAMGYCLISSCCFVGICAVGLLGPASLRELFYSEFLRPFPENYSYLSYVEGVILSLIFISAFISATSLSFFMIICYILYKEFEYTCRAFAMKIRPDGTFTDDLEKFRVMHQKRCKLVEEADGLYKMYVANAYLTLSPILCLQLYNLVYTDQVWEHRVVGLVLLAFVCIQVTLVSVATISVNGQAHAPLEFIYGIRARIQEESLEKRLVFDMFLNRLTGTSIGLTAWDMFVLNKPSMLTVSGMILTYFFLMAQLRYPSNIGVCICALLHGNGSDTGVNITGRQVNADV